MAVRDIEAFVRERAALFDANLDLNPGSPFDVQVVQPLVRRLGTDPFSVDLATFIDARLRQAFPDMAIDEGDALTDLLVKAATLLWDPIIREVQRVQQNLSFRDPTILTVDEAEALGSNLFSERRTGEFARGQSRVFFAQPQSISISPVNFVTSRAGLRFFPTEVQTIRVDEMLVNLDPSGSYYFDVNVVAEAAGDEYNIGIDELISIANVESAVRVTNLRRFRDGQDEDSAEEFIDRVQAELTERSLVVLRGIASQLTQNFPEVRRLNVVGFNDPEMQRDVITGGGAGPILASGLAGAAADDGENQAATRRFTTAEENFISLIGPTMSEPKGYVLTVIEGVDDASAPVAQDFDITAVVDANTVALEQQLLDPTRSGLVWMLRKKELTLSGIPGGILFPDGPQGLVQIEDGEVHVGGCTDMYIRAASFDEQTLVIDNVTDDVVELTGTMAKPIVDLIAPGIDGFRLDDFVLGTDYSINDPVFRLLESAGREGVTVQIVTGPNPTNFGVYRVVRAVQASGFAVALQVTPPIPVADGLDYRWRLFAEINIDLVDPKETRITDEGLTTTQSSDIVGSIPAINFDEYGVSEGDVLRILNGPDAGDFTIAEPPLAPSFDKLRVDTPLQNTASNLQFTVFRPNAAGGIDLPLIRISKIELLDSSNQPLGSTVPYANPIDIQSRAFQNPGRGLKHTLTDVQLGLISGVAPGGTFVLAGADSITLTLIRRDGSSSAAVAAIPASPSVAAVISAINTELLVLGVAASAFAFDSERFAVRPVGAGLTITGNSTVMFSLFGNSEPRTTADIRSATVNALPGPDDNRWDELSPTVDYLTGLDVLQVVSGNQIGFYSIPFSGPTSTDRVVTNPLAGLAESRALVIRDITLPPDETTRQLAPEENVRVEIGARSIGSVRCFFLEPTSIEFDENSRFTVLTDNGLLAFIPDPSLSSQLLPPLPSDNKSNDGSTAPAGDVLTALSQTFLRSGVDIGDELEIDYLPLGGTIALTDPVSGLAGTTLIFSIDNGPNLTLTFIRDDVSLAPDEVTRDGVVAQINAKAGIEIAQLTAGDEVEFEADALIIIRGTGTANPIILGDVAGTGASADFTADRTNESPHRNTYRIIDVDSTALQVTPAFAASIAPYVGPTLDRQGFRVRRPGVQRISTTEMSDQQTAADLYYFDVELISEGSGDLWNIDRGLQLDVEGFRSDGYYLTTDDSNLTFSIIERPKLVISKSILEQGVDDDPNNSTQIVGQNIQITYDRSQLVEDVQSFITSETARVTNESALARHLIPHFVRFAANYTGGSREEVVLADMIKYIETLPPADALESSDVQKVILDRGATSIDNPLDLIAVVHQIDRRIRATRSQNAITTGRLAAFIADVINLTREIV